MATWILILFFGPFPSSMNGRAIVTAEYTSQQKCIKAGELAKGQSGTMFGSIYYVCSEK